MPMSFLAGGVTVPSSYDSVTGVLSGKVTASGSTVSGLSVSIFIDGSASAAASVTTAADGSWTYTPYGLVPGIAHTFKATVAPVASGAGSGLPFDKLGPPTASFPAAASSGFPVAQIAGLSGSETVTAVAPVDGKLAIGPEGNLLLTGATASAQGTIAYTLTTSAGRTLALSVTATSAVAPAIPTGLNIVFEGDSITAGLGASASSKYYPSVAVASLPAAYASAGVTLVNLGTSGITSTTILANYASRAGGSAFVAGKINVLVLMIGTNDNAIGSGDGVYRNIRNYIRKARKTGYSRVVIGTLLSRDDDKTQANPVTDHSFNANTGLPLNARIRERWWSDLGADAIVDFAANPLFATAAAADNPTYYQQGSTGNIALHPTDAGYNAMGIVAAKAIRHAVENPLGRRQPNILAWSAFDAYSASSFSADGRSVTQPSGFGNINTRSQPIIFAKGDGSAADGKLYWETVVTNASNNQGFGVVNDAVEFGPSAGNTPFDGTNSVNGMYLAIGPSASTLRYYNGSAQVTTSMPATPTGTVVQWAVDLLAKKGWTRIAGGNWNGSASADPASGVGGIDLTYALSLGNDNVLYPASTLYAAPASTTCRFAAALFTGTIPSGFKAFDQ